MRTRAPNRRCLSSSRFARCAPPTEGTGQHAWEHTPRRWQAGKPRERRSSLCQGSAAAPLMETKSLASARNEPIDHRICLYEMLSALVDDLVGQVRALGMNDV